MGVACAAKNTKLRGEVVVATKVSGFNPSSETVGNRTVPAGPPGDGRLDSASIRAACAASLRRLQTPYIDLYQLHWPDRYAPGFGTTAYNPSKERADSVPIEVLTSPAPPTPVLLPMPVTKLSSAPPAPAASSRDHAHCVALSFRLVRSQTSARVLSASRDLEGCSTSLPGVPLRRL